MKIFWITNVVLPEANEIIGEKITPYGGWLVNSSYLLSQFDNIDLTILSPKYDTKTPISIKGEKIQYFLFPWSFGYDEKYNDFLYNYLLKNQPDIVHIYGSEYRYSLEVSKICKKLGINYVLSIQGLISVYANHFMANLSCQVQKKGKLDKKLRRMNLKRALEEFQGRGNNELELIKNSNNIIGRTTWDETCTYLINSNRNYYHCNEILRATFYEGKWDLNNVSRFSIFISQASYPIKGFHYVLEALRDVIKFFPETKVYISGINIFENDTGYNKNNYNYYVEFLRQIIVSNKLENHIIFLGELNEVEMYNQYLKSHVFVCPSAIENSPNSLGEAMVLGVPSIASYVGGIPDMLRDREEGFLYQTDAPYMLAGHLINMFSNDQLVLEISKKARDRALQTHDPNFNTNKLISIYNSILE